MIVRMFSWLYFLERFLKMKQWSYYIKLQPMCCARITIKWKRKLIIFVRSKSNETNHSRPASATRKDYIEYSITNMLCYKVWTPAPQPHDWSSCVCLYLQYVHSCTKVTTGDISKHLKESGRILKTCSTCWTRSRM